MNKGVQERHQTQTGVDSTVFLCVYRWQRKTDRRRRRSTTAKDASKRTQEISKYLYRTLHLWLVHNNTKKNGGNSVAKRTKKELYTQIHI